MKDWIGYRWLSETYDIKPVQPFPVISHIAGTRSSHSTPDCTVNAYTAQFRPEESVAGHLTFALKYEGVHLEFLSRFFSDVVDVDQAMNGWIQSEPTGAYARRACFLYEWLTGQQLSFPGVSAGNYVDALDESTYVTGSSFNSQRWRVRDNLPGHRGFCPVVRRTPDVTQAKEFDCASHLSEMELEFGQDLLQRSAVWLTIKESRASFLIEREQDKEDRIKRFAAAIANRCGQYDNPFDATALRELQRDILGDAALRYGLRQSPVFVGHVSGYAQVVDYVAPHWGQTEDMLEGLTEFLSRTTGESSVVRAAVASFGFVYIHPMADGNGRISRFLVNDVLRRDGAVPSPFILPVSATITHSSANRADYDRALERFSRPLMQRYADAYRFGSDTVADDGVVSNFEFHAYKDAGHAWRFPDLTAHVEYMGQVIQDTILKEMRAEAVYLRSHDSAREAVKAVLEGPDHEIDRIIRSVIQNGGKVSNKLAKDFPQVTAVEGMWEKIAERVSGAFEASAPSSSVGTTVRPKR